MTLVVDPTVVNWNDPDQGTGLPDYPQGPPGATGATGATGPRGSYWWQGSGPPAIGGAVQAQDMYLDVLTGDVYVFS